MKATKKMPEFKPMTGTTACIYCHKPLGDRAEGKSINITARDGGPRIGRAHADCVALAAGIDPASANTSPAKNVP
jgi:hypothetical protein